MTTRHYVDMPSVPMLTCERDEDCTKARWDEYVANSDGAVSPSQLDSEHFGLYLWTQCTDEFASLAKDGSALHCTPGPEWANCGKNSGCLPEVPCERDSDCSKERWYEYSKNTNGHWPRSSVDDDGYGNGFYTWDRCERSICRPGPNNPWVKEWAAREEAKRKDAERKEAEQKEAEKNKTNKTNDAEGSRMRFIVAALGVVAFLVVLNRVRRGLRKRASRSLPRR